MGNTNKNASAYPNTKHIDNPCKNCTTETGRCVNCHSNCQKYIEWKKHNDQMRVKDYNYRKKEFDVIISHLEGHKRCRESRRKSKLVVMKGSVNV